MTAVLKQHAKSITALAGVLVMVVGTELGTDSKWYTYVVAVLTAVGVYGIRNA